MANRPYTPVAQEELKHYETTYQEVPHGFGARHIQAFILFISLSVAIMIRAQLSVSIVAMTNLNDQNSPNCTEYFIEYPEEMNEFALNITMMAEDIIEWTDNETNYINTTESDVIICTNRNYTKSLTKWGVTMFYDWNKATQEMIMYSFVIGYTSMMVPVGLLVQKFGWKIPVAFALLTNGFLSIFTPWMITYGGWLALCIFRFLQGMTQSCFFPSVHSMLAKWSPLSERGRLSSYIYTGVQFGTVVALGASGILAENVTFGWPAAFWLSGLLCLICFGLVSTLGVTSPQEHPSISAEELTFITKTRGGINLNKVHVIIMPRAHFYSVLEYGETLMCYMMCYGFSFVLKGLYDKFMNRNIPWKHIFTSTAVWALFISQAGSTMTYLFSFSEIPLYMSHILHINLKNTGIFSSLPYIVMYFTNLLFGYLADYCVKNKYLTIINLRRVANTIGLVISGFFLLAFTFVDNIIAAVTLLILYLSLHSAIFVGFNINHVDLAPDFAGTLMAVGNMFAHLSSLLVPVIVSSIVGDDVTNKSKWQIVTMILLGILVTANSIFVIFVKGDVQSWNYSKEEKPRMTSIIPEIRLPPLRSPTRLPCPDDPK